MATQLKPLNNKKSPLMEVGYTITNQWGDILLNKDGVTIFRARINPMACCAFNEVNGFTFGGTNIRYGEKLQEAFNKFVQKCHNTEEGSYQIFILNKTTIEEEAKQPKWFIECLENYPGAMAMPWVQNMTHNGRTSVKMYMLPTYVERSIDDLKENKHEDDDDYDYD